ncbi:hypothetical protein TVAGG3_0117980, partial [Trichomonas vaginalis G3]|uniref:hypothetical protein n=1 Tax=Trichomonas vaginalis (strain ATCC PRA-98 / G3) TaxID=412133 RepID=UPI0021E52F39
LKFNQKKLQKSNKHQSTFRTNNNTTNYRSSSCFSPIRLKSDTKHTQSSTKNLHSYRTRRCLLILNNRSKI